VEAAAAIDSIEIVAVSATQKTVEIQVAEAGYWLLRCWFIDGSTITGVETLTPPETPGVGTFFAVTDADGLATVAIEHQSAASWRLCVAVIGAVSMSEALVVGV
jgi:hypothetical protein